MGQRATNVSCPNPDHCGPPKLFIFLHSIFQIIVEVYWTTLLTNFPLDTSSAAALVLHPCFVPGMSSRYALAMGLIMFLKFHKTCMGTEGSQVIHALWVYAGEKSNW